MTNTFSTAHIPKQNRPPEGGRQISSMSRSGLVDRVLKTLTSFELRLFGSRDLYRFAGARIATRGSFAVCNAERSEAN